MSELKPGIPFVQINIESPKDPPSGDFVLSEEEEEEEDESMASEEPEVPEEVEEEEMETETEVAQESSTHEAETIHEESPDNDELQEVIVTQDTTEERWQDEEDKPALEGEKPIDSWQSPSTWKIYRNPTNISNDYFELYYSMNSENSLMPTICFLKMMINFFKIIGKFY